MLKDKIITLAFVFIAISSVVKISTGLDNFETYRKIFDLKNMGVSELHVFFCQYDEDVGLAGLREEPVTKLYILDGSEDAASILTTARQRSKHGIILDLSCAFSRQFLYKSSEGFLFNITYSWIIVNEKDDVSFLRDLNLSLDTDLTVVQPDGSMLDAYKPHYTNQLFLQFLGRLPTDSLITTDKRNGYGSELNVALIGGDKSLKESDVDRLCDPVFRPEDHPGLRIAVPLSLALREAMNVTYRIVWSDSWGINPEKKGNWTGFVGLYQRGEIDLSFHPLKYRKDRMDQTDIGFALAEGRCVYFFLQPPMFGSARALIVPLSQEVWAILGFTAGIFIVAFRIISRFDESPDVENWSAVMIHTVGTIAQQGFNDTTNLVSIRVSSFSLLMFSFLVYLYYGAAVLNGLLSPSPNTITTEKQLLDSGMKIGIYDKPYMTDLSSDESLLGPHTEQTLRMLEKAKKQDRMFFDYDEGISLVLRSRFTLIIDTLGLIPGLGKKLSGVQLCSASFINKIPPFTVGLNIKRHSPYKQEWMSKLVWMKEVGIVKRSRNIWNPSKPACVWRQEALSIGLQATSVAVLLALAALLLSAIILPLEIFHYNLNKHI